MAPAYDWSGFYIGLNGGGGSSHSCQTGILDGTEVVPPYFRGCNNATGGTVGGQVGYRWQMTSWVFGVEAQGNWADFKGSNLAVDDLPNIFPLTTKVDLFGLFTGQVGYALNNLLLYVKGGAAVTHNKYTLGQVVPDNIPLEAAGSELRWGGVIGAGLEYGFSPNWSVALEYDHLFMGTQNMTMFFIPGVGPVGPESTSRVSQDVDIGTIRLNYRFGGPVVARY